MIFGTGAAVKITVLAAASLTSVFPKIDSHQRYSFAGSDQLAFQIQQGAPADVYAAANTKYPDQLYAQGLCEKPRIFATNELVLIVPRENDAGIHSVRDLTDKGVRIVIAAAGVPVGDYTRKVLSAMGVSAAVMKNVVSQENDVKSVLAKVALGEADAGFVYRTDVLAAVRDVYAIRIPDSAQPVVRYELCVVTSTHHLYTARKFVARVLSGAGRLQLARAGFGLP